MTLTLIRGAISDGYLYVYKSILISTILSDIINDTLKKNGIMEPQQPIHRHAFAKIIACPL